MECGGSKRVDYNLNIISSAAEEGQIFYAAPLVTQPKLSPPFNTKLTIVNVEALRLTNNTYFRQLVQDTLDMADQSLISAHISKTFPLKGVNEAIQFIQDKKCTGKVVIDMDDDDDDDDNDDDWAILFYFVIYCANIIENGFEFYI